MARRRLDMGMGRRVEKGIKWKKLTEELTSTPDEVDSNLQERCAKVLSSHGLRASLRVALAGFTYLSLTIFPSTARLPIPPFLFELYKALTAKE